jgi:hypothetical protein
MVEDDVQRRVRRLLADDDVTRRIKRLREGLGMSRREFGELEAIGRHTKYDHIIIATTKHMITISKKLWAELADGETEVRSTGVTIASKH